MKSIIKYTLITAIRDWLFVALFILILASYYLSSFMGNTALVEQSQMTLAYFAGLSRLLVNIGFIVFICFHVRRAFDNREIESILSKPISRTEFVLAYWISFIILTLLAIIPVIIILSTLTIANSAGITYWCLSLITEVAIICAFSLMAALMMKSAVFAVMSSLTFYFISRLMGFFTLALNKQDMLVSGGDVNSFMIKSLKIISSVIPRLDLYAKSKWLIYGVEGQADLWIFQAQSIYIFLLLAMTIFDFKRKQF